MSRPATPQFRSAWRDRLRYQLAGALILGLVFPYALLWLAGTNGLNLPLVQQTLAGSAIAIIVGALLVRSLSVFPGTEAAAAILPSFFLSFALTLAIFLFARLEYNRTLLLSGLLLSVAWFFFLQAENRRRRKVVIGVVPFGSMGTMPSLRFVTWRPMESTTLTEPVDAVVADLRTDLPDEWDGALADYALAGIPVYHVKSLVESLTGVVELEHLSENSFGTLTPLHAYMRFKHLLDWFAAAIVLLVGGPLLIVVALAIKIGSPGPALFVQARMGQNGRVFRVVKFRTMRDDAGSEADARHAAMTIDDDARITALGRWLRRTRIDELPQIWNILRGEMSWIGPRPEAVVLSRWYEEELPFYRYRHIVRPGITGWAQVNQGHVTGLDDIRMKLNLDFYYIKHFSPWLDLLIVARTLATMTTGYGSR